MRKIIFRVLMLFLFAVCCTFFMVSAAGVSGTKDDLVQDYIREMVPDGAEFVNSSCHAVYCEQNSGAQTDVAGKMQADAYTYRYTVDGGTVYRCVIVLEFLEKIRITENDLLEVSMNDYLFNYSPEDGRLFTRSSLSEEWGGMREITPMPTGISPSTVSVYGSEMKSGAGYSLILISFPAEENPDPTSTAPEYRISFTHDAQVHIPLWGVVLFIVLGLVVPGAVLWKKRTSAG